MAGLPWALERVQKSERGAEGIADWIAEGHSRSGRDRRGDTSARWGGDAGGGSETGRDSREGETEKGFSSSMRFFWGETLGLLTRSEISTIFDYCPPRAERG